MTQAELQRMRLCFRVAAVWCGWSEEKQARVSARIRSAIASGNQRRISRYLAWLERESDLNHLSPQCRAAEARIKDSRRKAA